MKKWTSSIGILFFVIVSIPCSTLGHSDYYSDKDKHSIVGKWDSVIRTNGSGLTLEFLSDGTFRENADFEKEGRYALKDDQLTTYVWDSKENREKQRVFDLRLNRDNIAMKESNGAVEIQMERVCKGSSAPADILGEWFSPNYPGAIPVFPADMPLRFPVFVEFTREKKIFFRSTPTKSTQGQYEFSGGALLLTACWQQAWATTSAMSVIRKGAGRGDQGKLPLWQHAVRGERGAHGRHALYLFALRQARRAVGVLHAGAVSPDVAGGERCDLSMAHP